MAIAAVRGAVANLASAATSLAFASAAQTSGDTTVIAVAILDTTRSVTSISDGTNSGTLRTAQNNSTNVRVELWTLPIASSATRTITINFSGSTLASAAYEEYSGSTGIGNLGTAATGTGQDAQCSTTQQDTSSRIISANAIASLSGDTLSAVVGANPQSVIPALTTAGVSLMDNTSVASIRVNTSLWISASRAWAAAGLELRTGVAATAIGAENAVGSNVKSAQNYQVVKPPPQTSGVTPRPVAQVLQGGTIGIAYSETISVAGGVSPYTFSLATGTLPAGCSLNSSTGVISGTPTTAATYNFTIQVQDANGVTASQAFQVTVVPPTGGGNFAWAG